MSDITIQPYQVSSKNEWDSFLFRSKNATFLFNRNYMDYHSDRFPDLSWLFLKKGKIIGVLPGTLKEDIFSSHAGLTYGGVVLSPEVGMMDVLHCFESLNFELRKLGVRRCVYKPVPHIYHKIPAEEELYALFKLGARLIGRNYSSTISLRNRIPFAESRKSGVRKARKNNIRISETDDLVAFWGILHENLMENYGVPPVHSLAEIRFLKSNFPSEIRLFCAFEGPDMVGGTLVYEMGDVLHVQYISANARGKDTGALDAIFHDLINSKYSHLCYFDFGVSTEKMGQYINVNLLFQKEGFGGRGIVYDVYEYEP